MQPHNPENCLHPYPPCVKDHVFMQAIQTKGLVTETDNTRRLLTKEGCGNCPKNLGACALLNSIGQKDQINDQHRRVIISRLTA